MEKIINGKNLIRLYTLVCEKENLFLIQFIYPWSKKWEVFSLAALQNLHTQKWLSTMTSWIKWERKERKFIFQTSFIHSLDSKI